jgi:tetratricopeptide (TPR) repeat protein
MWLTGRRLAVAVIAALAAAIAIEGARLAFDRVRERSALRTLFGRAMRGGLRPFEARLSHPLIDGYRPSGGECGAVDFSLLGAHRELAAIETAGDVRGLASVYAVGCDVQRARRLLEELPPSPDASSDLGALLIVAHDPSGALTHLDQALRMRPGHPQALWNRALVLEALELPLAAAHGWRAVAALREPGWAHDAAARASRLERAAEARLDRYAQAQSAVRGLARGEAPPAALAHFPDLVRSTFLEVLAGTRPEARAGLLGAARTIDGWQGGSSLAALVAARTPLPSVSPLLAAPVTAEKGEAMRRLAASTGDPWLEIQSWQLAGRLASDARDEARTEAAFGRALDLCRVHEFPLACADTRLWMARFHTERYQLHAAHRLALEAKRDCRRNDLPDCELRANSQLQRIESFRSGRGLPRAFAEENSLHQESCERSQPARELLAEIALDQDDVAEARRQLAEVRGCGAGGPRFEGVGVGVLADLVRDPAGHTDRELAWFEESLAAHLTARIHAGRLDVARWHLFEGRAFIEREPARARAILEKVIADAEALGPADEGGAALRMQALSTLVMGAERQGDHPRALALLGRALRVAVPAGCVVGAWARSAHRVFLARGPASSSGAAASTVGVYAKYPGTAPGPRLGQEAEEPGLPASITSALDGCERVDVLATWPFLGRARLLPERLSWGYLRSGESGPLTAGSGAPRALLVEDVEPPAALGLAPLEHHGTSLGATTGAVQSLRGSAATPGEVLRRLPEADVVELNVHGIFHPDVSDAPVLVLSPDAGGRNLLSARDIERLRLDRHPAVILAACEVAQNARYWSIQHSLPESFIRAGARWVLASPAPVEDSQAGTFFENVWARVRSGKDVAVALRDERLAPDWSRDSTSWIRDVVAFYQ